MKYQHRPRALKVIISRVMVLISVSLLTSSLLAMADEVAPAMSEDLQAFDQMLERSQAKQPKQAVEAKQRNEFGKFVSEEARKLKDASLEERKAFGKKVAPEGQKQGLNPFSGSAGAPDFVRDRIPSPVSPGTGSGGGFGAPFQN